MSLLQCFCSRSLDFCSDSSSDYIWLVSTLCTNISKMIRKSQKSERIENFRPKQALLETCYTIQFALLTFMMCQSSFALHYLVKSLLSYIRFYPCASNLKLFMFVKLQMWQNCSPHLLWKMILLKWYHHRFSIAK